MTTHVVNTHEAKTRLSELIREAELGNDVIVARNGRPVAKIIPWPSPRPRRQPGAWVGRVEIAGDIVGSDPDVLEAFAQSEASADS
ncbi:MAG TPA: type II toxin-antitoxin system prevent-host-death family antitoxin [Microthrixaceae bacterium]|nr:type II toxin-antitoxin system prevent-host-death family antitoxin [Microthrixaceae bacterium]HNI35619.1 type II toxin-antitoxin system prevent-host-death family antitoxin [Microthrixaceae bacterium]